jgi:hypothetical protein
VVDTRFEKMLLRVCSVGTFEDKRSTLLPIRIQISCASKNELHCITMQEK